VVVRDGDVGTDGGQRTEPSPAVVDVTTHRGGPLGLPDVVVVRLAGDVNLAAAPRVEAALSRLENLPDQSSPASVVDLTDVRYLDSRAVRALFTLADRFAAGGRTLHVVVALGSKLVRVMRIMQLDTLVAVHSSLDEALAAAQALSPSSPPPA
jgi:anti-anti-sigma factor